MHQLSVSEPNDNPHYYFKTRPDFILRLQVSQFISKPAGALNRAGRMTMAKRGYLEYRRELADRMRLDIRALPFDFPLKTVKHIDYVLYLKTLRRDLSNIREGITDAGNKVLWVDDRSTNISSYSVRLKHVKNAPQESLFLAVWV